MRDRAVIKRIRQGDRAEGERFVTEHYPAVYRLLRWLTGDVAAAEDLAQQTFLRAWEALDRFESRSSVKTWLHRIAYHEYTHWLRARRPSASLDAVRDLPDPRTATPSADRLLLPQALGQLSCEHRDTFLLYYVQQLSVPEVAQLLDVPVGTVKSRLFAARQQLRDLLGAEAEPALPPPAVALVSPPVEGGTRP